MNPLNPVMAVLALASVGALPLRALSADVKKPAGVAVAAESDNSINALTKLLADKNGEARRDAGKRIEEFLVEPDSEGKRFVAADIDADTLERLRAVARQWGESEGALGDVAILYFVAGPGRAAPKWALKDPVLKETFVPGLKWEKSLREALADWTGPSQINKTRAKGQDTAFLNVAVAKARTVFAHKGPASDAPPNNAPPVPDGRGRGGSEGAINGSTQKYELTDLYNKGAKFGGVAGPKDAKPPRVISLKIYSKLMPDNSIVNEIAVCDISDTNKIVCQRFPVDAGDQAFVLNDLEPGKRKYELKFGVADAKGDRSITFARPDGGESLSTSVAELFRLRAEQAKEMGNIIKRDGQEYYVLPQGGSYLSALLLFPKAVIDGRDAGDHRDLAPALTCGVGTRGPDGRNLNVKAGDKGGPHCGKAGGKEYHLEWNGSAWELKDGPGDPPPAPPKPASGGGSAGGGGKPSSGDEGVSIADLEAKLLATPGCTKKAADTEGLRADLKGKYGIVSCVTAVDGPTQIILVPKSVTQHQQLVYKNLPDSKLQRARFLDQYLVLHFEKQVEYLDLLQQDESGEKTGNLVRAGFVDREKKHASKFSHEIPFVDALKSFMGIKPGSRDAGAAREVPKRLKEVLGSKTYALTGAIDQKDELVVNAVSGGETYQLWFKVRLPGDAPEPAIKPYTTVGGMAANAMDQSLTRGDDGDFPPKLDLPGDREAKPMKGRVSKDIALYESEDAPKRYFAMFRYDALEPKDSNKPDGGKAKKTYRQRYFEVFSSTHPLPASFDQKGLVGGTEVKDVDAASYRFVSGTSREKGVLAVFQNKQVGGAGQKNAAKNCVGPIIWWGLDRGEAEKVCKEDKF